MKISRSKNVFRNIILLIDTVVLIVLGYLGQNVYQEWWIKNEKQNIADLLQIHVESVEQIISRRLALVDGLEKFVIDRNDIDIYRDFPLFASGLHNDSLGVRNVAIGPKGILTLVYPIQGNEQALYYNLLTDEAPSVKSDMARTLETKKLLSATPLY